MTKAEELIIEGFKAKLRSRGVPEHDLQGMAMYVFKGQPPGDFLRAVYENNLMEAFGRADEENRDALFHICSALYNDFPAPSHGSPERVEKWLEAHAKRREAEEQPS